MNPPGKDVDIPQWDKITIAHLFLHFFTLRSVDGGCYNQFNISVNALMLHGAPVPPWSCSWRGVEQKSSGTSQVPWDPRGTAAIAEGQKATVNGKVVQVLLPEEESPPLLPLPEPAELLSYSAGTPDSRRKGWKGQAANDQKLVIAAHKTRALQLLQNTAQTLVICFPPRH